MRYILPISAAPLLLSAVALAGGQEVPIEFRESADLKGFTPYGGAYTQLQSEVPTGEWKLPELASETPLYGLAKLGDSEFLMILDASGGGDALHDVVYFDQNGNRDLTDEEPFKGSIMEFGEQAYFMVMFEDQAFVDYELDGETFPYVLGLQVSGMNVKKLSAEEREGYGSQIHPSINLSTACCYVGEFENGERKFQVRLGDTNCDGRFDEMMNIPKNERIMMSGGQLYAQGDHLYLTHEKELTYNDLLPLGDHLILGETCFGVEVDIPQGHLTLTEKTENLQPLKLSQDTQRLVAHARDFKHSVMMYDPGQTVQLPAGDYRLLSYAMLGKGEKGDVWRVAGGGTEKTPFVTVGGEGEALMEFGEPFVATAEIPRWYREMEHEDGKTQAMINFRIRGAGHEVVTDLGYVSGSGSSIAMSSKEPNRPAEPTYTIVKKNGELVEKGSFEYG